MAEELVEGEAPGVAGAGRRPLQRSLQALPEKEPKWVPSSRPTLVHSGVDFPGGEEGYSSFFKKHILYFFQLTNSFHIVYKGRFASFRGGRGGRFPTATNKTWVREPEVESSLPAKR